jgi:sn-glycerol 3-phosphate transport system ATP-binding protein
MRISLRGLTKRFGGAVAVDGLSLDVRPGELVSLVGGSGCGKTTTLRMIAGFERPDAGEVRFDERVVNDVSPRRRNVGIVFQSYALFPTMTVAENIAFGLRVARWPEMKLRDRVAEMVALTHLGGMEGRYANQLSGGQQQRVALGRALIAETPVCLMDEPLSNLDAQLRAEMRREIRALQQQLGITMVYVTHDQTEAMSMADQVILMREGRIEQDATPGELYARPATAFVARFIGTPPMNVLTLADGLDGAVLAGTPGPATTPGKGAGLLLGVRPEDIVLAPAGGVPVRVVAVEYLGADSIVVCAAGDQPLAVRAPGRVELPVGAVATATWAPGAGHLFDAATGRRLNP